MIGKSLNYMVDWMIHLQTRHGDSEAFRLPVGGFRSTFFAAGQFATKSMNSHVWVQRVWGFSTSTCFVGVYVYIYIYIHSMLEMLLT